MSAKTSYTLQATPRRWPLVLLFGFLVLAGADQTYRLVIHAKVQRELSALRQEGFPLNVRELQHWRPAVPDQENAALRIMEAADSLALGPDASARDKLPGRAGELGPDERETLKTMLTNNAPALEAAHLAAHLKQSRFPIDYSRGPNTLLPHLAKLKSIALLLRAEATVSSEEGRPDLAVQSNIDGVSLARSLDADPLLIESSPKTPFPRPS